MMRGSANYYCGAVPLSGGTCVRPTDHEGPHISAKAWYACPLGTCNPVDICDRCRCIVTVAGDRAYHTDAMMQARADHEAAPIVICAWCGTQADPVSPAELAEAWGDMLAASPVKGQTSWLA